jgi:hypothetical protein
MKQSAEFVRPAAMAGKFYPASPPALEREIDQFLEEGRVGSSGRPKGLIAPHAGYLYSGPVAGSSFRPWAEERDCIHRVILLGPTHWFDFDGLALPRATAFDTPLGRVPVDADLASRVRTLPQVVTDDEVHAPEHCLEVELPFLQRLLGEFTVVPLLVGRATDAQVSEVVDLLWDGPETRFVVSSDLSHYHDYGTARRLDLATARTIEQGQAGALHADQACGHRAIRGFLQSAAGHGLSAETVDLRNSGDTAGPRDRVVGYGAFLFGGPAREDLP